MNGKFIKKKWFFKIFSSLQANSNVNNLKLVSAILVGALFPNVVQVMTPHAKFNQSSTGMCCLV